MPSQIANAAAIRSSGWSVRAYASFITGGTPVATGTVTNTPPYPMGGVAPFINTTYATGAYTDVERGMEVVFTDAGSGKFKGRTRVRVSQLLDAANIPVPEYTQAMLNLSAGDEFAIYDEFRLAPKLVAALADFPPEILYYTDEGSNPPPLACSGGHWAGFVDAGQTYATVLTQGDTSIAVDPDSGGDLTHLWTLPSGVAFAPGSSSSDANPTLRANVGEWVVYHTVTDDDNSKSVTQHIVLKVHDTTSMPHRILYTPDDATAESGFGGGVQIVAGATTQAAIPDGCLCIIWGVETLNGTPVAYRNAAPGRGHIFCVGIVRRDSQSGQPDGSRQVSFEVISPLARLRELTSYSKVMLNEATPDSWSELKTLSVQRAIIQIIQFYTTLVEAGFDVLFDADFINYLYPAFYLNASDFIGQLNELAQGVDARITCDRTGRFSIHTDPKYIPEADRAAVTKTWTFARRDVLPFTLEREHFNNVRVLKASGFTGGAANNQPLFSVYPGKVDGEGLNAPNRERLIVTDQDDLNERTGRYGAALDAVFQNSDGELYRAFPLTLTLRGIYDFFDFSKEYVDFSETLQGLARDVDLTDFLFCLKSTRVDYDFALGSAITTAVFDVVTSAAPGETFIPADGGSGISDGQLPPFEPPLTTPPPAGMLISGGTGRLLTIDSANNLYYTASANSASPTWVEVPLSLTGTVCDFVPNAFSPLYLGTGTTVELFVATTTRIYLVEFDTSDYSVTETELATLSSTAFGLRRIETERADEGFVVVTSVYVGGATETVSSTDGVTFGSPVTISGSGGGSYGTPGLYVDPRVPARVLTSTNTTGAASDGRVSTDSGASFGALSSPNIDSDGSAFSLHVPYHDNPGIYAYFGGWAGTGQPRTIKRASGSGAPTNISPTDGGGSWGAQLVRSIDTCPINRLRLAACLRNGDQPAGADTVRVYYSLDGGTTWSYISALDGGVGGAYWTIRCAGDDPNIFWALGEAGRIAKCNFQGQFQNLHGNLAALGAGWLTNLAGW